jgi:SAM-dependent methyltransferase
MPPAEDDPNSGFQLHYVQNLASPVPLRVLDYGCGKGEVVRLLRNAGIDCIGCDIYYSGSEGVDSPLLQDLLEQGHVRPIEESEELPFPQGSFDVILANQVFEHVEHLEATLQRLERILKDDGQMCLHFPTLEVVREGHIGIPLVHRLSRNSRFRFHYTVMLRRLGFGYRKGEESPKDWATLQLNWLDTYCFYRPWRTLRRTFEEKFTVQHSELEYIRYRARNRKVLTRLLEIPVARWFAERLFRRVAFTAVVLKKRR